MAGTPKFIILSEQFRGRTFELTQDQHTVGRVDERDICIKDPTVSTYHCRFIKDGNTYILEDQGSTNGTRVNNVPIVSQSLQNSDILQIGGVEILFDCDDKSATTVVQQQTKTDIDITAASTTQQIRRMEQLGFSRRNQNNKAQKLMLGVIALLAVLVVCLLIFLVVSIFNKPKNTGNSFYQHAPAGLTVPDTPVARV
jgi:pSer/pThr/pTyr-binding forkhead associated (FHA) protein